MERTSIESDSSKQRQFFWGPVDINWLVKAAALRGKTLHLGVVILFLGRVSGNDAWIKLSPSLLRRFSIHRNAAYRALAELTDAGLVKVVRQRRGAAAVVALKNHIPAGMSWDKEIQ